MAAKRPANSRQKSLILDYLREVYVPRRLTLKPLSIAQIETSLRSLETFAKRTVRLDQLTNDLLCRWLCWRLKHVSKATAKRDRVNLLAVWRDAMTRGKCRRSVIDVPVIRVPRKVPLAVPVTDIEKLLSAAASYQPKRRRQMPACGSWANWWVALLLTAYDCGARLNALLSVRVRDCDLVGMTIRLRDDSAKTELEQLLPISPQTRDAIAKMMTRSPTALLFDFPCVRRMIWKKLKALADSAGVSLERYQAFHSIRKTHATLTTALLSVEQAASNLGHTSTAMTWSRYVDPRLLKSLQSPAVNVLPRPVFAAAREHQLRLFG